MRPEDMLRRARNAVVSEHVKAGLTLDMFRRACPECGMELHYLVNVAEFGVYVCPACDVPYVTRPELVRASHVAAETRAGMPVPRDAALAAVPQPKVTTEKPRRKTA